MASNPSSKIRVGVWIRVSTPDQAAGESPEHHLIRGKQYAAMNDWTVVETYDLAGVSGKTVWEHPECQRMLRDVKRGHIQGLIFSKLARLARNTRELLDFSEYFQVNQAHLISLEEKFDTSTPAGRLFFTFIGAIASWEREEIASRVKASISVRAKLGKPLGSKATYGFKWEKQKLVQVPEEILVRKLAFDLFLEHRRKGAVSRLLNQKGYRTRDGKKFRDMNIRRMLECTSAIGNYRTNQWKALKNGQREMEPESEWGSVPCEPVVSDETFRRVSEILEQQVKPARKPGKKPVQIFAGLLKCGCGGKLYVYTRSPNYTCQKCKNKISKATMEEIFLGTIADELTDPTRLTAHIEKAKQKISERQALLSGTRKKIDATKAEMHKLYELYIAGSVDTVRFKQINDPLEERLAQLLAETPKIEGEISAIEVNNLTADAIAQEAKGLATLWPTLNTEGKQRLASLLCSEIIIPTDPNGEIKITLTTSDRGSDPTDPEHSGGSGNGSGGSGSAPNRSGNGSSFVSPPREQSEGKTANAPTDSNTNHIAPPSFQHSSPEGISNSLNRLNCPHNLTLTGSGNLSVLGGSGGSTGVVSIGNASGYTGTITVGTGGILGIGNSSGGNFFGSSNAISISTVNAGVALEADGNGTSTPETISYVLPSNPINWVAANTTGYFVGKQGATILSNQEANKTLAVTTNLPFNNTNTLNVTPLNGYGLLLANQAALTATTTYNLNGTQASNVVPGLVLSNLSGGFGIVKTGTGTLQLGTNAADTTNSFGGAGLLIDITGGIVAASSDANLGAAGNGIKLNVNGATQGFRALDTFATSRVFTLAQGANGIDVVFGKTLTLNSGLAYSAVGNTFQKNDNGTLVLTAAASGAATSATTVSAGVLAITNSNQLASGALTIVNAGSSLALSGGGTISQAIALNGSGISSARGGLTNTSGATTVGGIITINGGSLITNEDTGNVFTLGAITNATTGFNVGGAGSTTIGGIISGGGVVNAVGSGTLRLTAANTVTNTLSAQGGTLVFSGAAGANGAGGLAANYGGTMTFDNAVANLNNRNSTSGLGVAPHSIATTGGGTINLIGNSAASSTETLFGFNPGRGQTTVTITPNASQPANLVLGSLGRAQFGTVTFGSSTGTLATTAGVAGTGSASINAGTGATAGNFLGAGTVQTGTANMAILPWATVNSGGTISLATSSVIGASGYLRNLGAGDSTSAFLNLFDNSPTSTLVGSYNNSTTVTTTNTTGLVVGQSVSGLNIPANNFITAITPGVSITLNAATTGGATTNAPLTYSTTGTNINLTSAASGPTATLAQSINSLTLGTGGSLTLANSNQVITLGGALGGAVLSLDNAATISGGQLTAGTNELIFHTPSNLGVSSNIIGGAGGSGNGLTKAGAGTLTLTGNSFHSGQTIVNEGTLNLNAGNNTIQFANYMAVNAGTVNLNGNSQIVTDLFSDSTALSGVGTVGANSLITGTSGATIVLRRDASARTYTGQIGGSVGVLVGGGNANWTLTRDQLYSGPTLINGGNTVLQNTATLGSTSSLTINGGNLTLDNNGSIDVANRLPDALAISMGNGGITYVGRTQFNSAETIGAITTTVGTSTISVTQQTTNVSAATLTLGGGISRTRGSNVNFANTNGTLGTIGSNPQILYTTAPTLTNSIIGGGYTVNSNDWASYNATYGVGALGTTGFAGYSPLLLNNAASTDNISMSGSTGVNLNNLTINSLRAGSNSTVNFNAGQTLTVASGGILANNAVTLTLGSAINNGNVTSGGNELFLTGSGTINVNSAITGNVSLVKSVGTVTLSGTNTYTGGTYGNGGALTLANAGNVTTGLTTLGTGGIFLSSATLNQTAGAVIPSQAVTIYGATNSGSTAFNLNSNLSIANSVTTAGSNVITVPNTNGIAVGQLVTGTGIPSGAYVTAVNPANNTVTITTGTGVTAGTNTLSFLVNNTLSNVTFNNTGGATNPTIGITGLLNLPNATITASSSNPSSTSTISGGNVDFNNAAAPLITVNPISFNGQNIAPLQPTLAISSVIQGSSNAISVTGGGNLQLSGASIFTGGVTLAGNATPSLATNLTIAANSSNMASGLPINGPLGTGTFTIGQNSTLLSTGAFTVGNNVVVSGNFNFDAPSTAAASLALGANSSTISLPASAATTINVNAPNMTGMLGGSVTGAGSSIVKTGLGTLRLDNGIGGSSTFSGGVTLNAGTLLATGVGGTGTSLGTGTVTINGGLLALRHSGQTNNSVITYGNNVTINGTLSNAFIDINNNGANTGNTIGMGTLDYTGFSAGNPAPTTLLNVTGGNNYKLLFTGTTLTGATTSPTFNVGSGLSLILPGGFTIGTNLPKNIGTGTLVYSGSNLGATVSSPITGTVTVAPLAALSNTPLGTGGLTLNGGSALNISPLYSSSVSTTGYTAGGMTGKYYFSGATTMASASNYGIAPNSTLVGIQASDSFFRQLPNGVNSAGGINTLAVYQSLLTVTTGGTYYFGGGTDDMMQVVVDGQVLQQDIGAGHALNQQGLQSVTLAAGTHVVTVRAFNNGGGGGVNFFYSGPDTAGNGITGTNPVNNLQALPLNKLSYATDYTLANNYQNAAILNNAISVAAAGTATIDGQGTDFNYAIPSLTLGNGSTLNAANGTGAVGSIGNGAFIVTGTTTLGTTGILNPTTATLVLAGGVSDGGNGLTKTGAGNVILGSSSAFTGALNINGGFVTLNSGTALTTGTTTIGVATTTPATLDLNGQTVTTTGNIILNGGAGPAGKSSNAGAGLYNSSANTASLPASGTLSIGAPTATVNASVGGFGDIVLNGVVQDSVAGSAWNKVGPNFLTLNGTNTFTGQLNITSGKVILGNTSALGTVAGATVVSGGATLDLNGLTIGAEPVTLNGAGQTGIGAANALGALINSNAANASLSGNITLGAVTSIGGPSLLAGTNGGITLSGTVAGAFAITKVGTNSLTFTNGTNSATSVDVQNGSVTFSGAGKKGVGNEIVRGGATLTLDNSGTAVSGRLGVSSPFVTGNFTIIGNSTTAVNETFTTAGNNINIGAGNGIGGATITLNAASTAGVSVVVNSTSTSIFNRGPGSTLLLRGDNLGSTPGANTANLLGGATSLGQGQTNGQSIGQTGGVGATNRLIYPWAVVDTSSTGVGTSFAAYKDNTSGIQPLQAGDFVATAPTIFTLSGNTNATNTVTMTNTTGLVAGMLVTGTGIPAGTIINTVNAGASIVLSANATATANNTLSFYGIGATPVGNIANLVSTNATNAIGSASAAQLLNSLTLNNPAGSATTITGGLQLDSGGLLAVGTNGTPDSTVYTLGGAMLSGVNNLNRELIIHTTGTGTTLNITAPIFVNGNGLTKADGGKLILGAAGIYTGDTSLTGGLTVLNGGNNTIFKPFSTAPTSGNNQATSNGGSFSGQNFTVNFGATLDLNGNNQAVANLRSGSGVQLMGGTIINGPTATTATFHSTLNGNQTWAGNISNAGAGTLNFVRDGNNTLTINSPNTFGGSATFTGGATLLVDLGTFQNASSVNVTRSALIWDNTGTQVVTNRFSATAPINLSGGGLQFRGRAGSGSTPVDAISLGTVNLGVGASDIVAPTVNQGGALQVTFAGIGTRAAGATLNFGQATFATGDNPNFFFTSAPALSNGIIGGWATGIGLISSTGGTNAGFVTYDPASGVRLLQYQPNATYGAGVNTMLNSTSPTLPAPIGVATTTTVNSITLYNSTVNFTNAFDTLLVQSGGVLNGTGASSNIGTTAVPGILQSGAGNDLYLHSGSNTLTINSKIIDNSSNNNVLIDALSTGGANVTLTNANTYGGTTYVSGATLNLTSALGAAIPGSLVLSGSNNAATDSLSGSSTMANWNLSNQMASTGSITLNGGAGVNIGNSSNNLVSNTQTINNLTFQNDGGTNTAVPDVRTGAGGLVINGTLSSINNTEVATIPVMHGFYTLTTGNIVVDANQYVPNQIGLALEGNITSASASSLTKTGNGWLGLGGQSANYTGAFNLNAGGLAVAANSGGSGAILGGQIVMAANTAVDARGATGTFGSIASFLGTPQILNGLQGTAGSIVTGLDGTNTSFAGTINSPYPTGLLNLTKIGVGDWTLTNDSSATNNGTLTLSGGGVILNGAAGKLSFTTTTLQTGGSITLNNANALSNRLGGAVLSTTAATLAPTYRVLNMNGGNLVIGGNSSIVVNEALGNISSISGGGIITLNAASTAGVNVTLGQIAGHGNNTSLLIRGDGLGTAAGANVATLQFTTAGTVGSTPGLTYPGAQGGGANNTTTRTIRPDIIVDNTATGNGAGFLTIDATTGLVRPLGYGAGISYASELANTLTTATTATTNVGLTTAVTGTATVTANSITLLNGGGINLALVPTNPWGADGTRINVNVQNSAGLLALTGNTGVTAGQYRSSTGTTPTFQVPDAANSFTLNAPMNTNAGWTKAGAGTLILAQPHADAGTGTSTVAINGGTVQFAANLGANPIFVKTTATTPTGTALALNNGTLDLNGNNQLVGALTTANPLPFAGGTAGNPNSVITSSTAATFTTNNTSSVVGTVFSGSLSLDKAGTGTMTLSSPQTYTGSTSIRGGTLTLRDSGSLASTGPINVNYGILAIDNQGLADSTTRISATAPINLTGGSYRWIGSERVESFSLGTVALNGGMNEFNISPYSSNPQGTSYTLNIANLTQSGSSSLNLVSSNSTYGSFNAANPHVYLTQLNGAAFNAASMTNGIIAPWMTVNQNDWATYTNANGITIPGNNGAPGYSGNALNAGVATDNINLGATVQNITARTINSLAVRSPGAGTTIGLQGPLDRLTIGSGGVLINSGQSVAIQGGSLTSGTSSLYVNSFGSGVATINSPIANNGATPLSVIRNGGGTVTLSPQIVQTVGTVTVTNNTFTVPNTTGLFVGMAVSGSGIPAGEFITGISGNVVTITTATGVTAATNSQITFAPPSSAATSGTTIGTPTVTTAVNSFAGGAAFVPTIGMAVGGPNIPGGTTLVSFTGTNATGFSLTLSQNALATSATNTVTLGASSEAFTGALVSGSGNLTTAGGAINLSGLPGAITVPGDLTINSSTVTMQTNQGQIAAGSNVTLNGGSTLTLVGTNWLNNTLRFNNSGGATTPIVTVGTLLDIATNTASGGAVNAINDNTAFTPTISGGTLNLSSATGTTLTVAGNSPDGLIISSAITTNTIGTTTSTGQTIIKAGTGSLVLPNANAAVLKWDLNAGSMILNNATALGATGSTLAISGPGTLMAGTVGNLAVATPITFSSGGSLTFGGTSTQNALTLSGAMNLGGATSSMVFNVVGTQLADTISGNITNGTGGITKSGNGALTLSGSASTFTGPITVSSGMLTLGNVAGFGGTGNATANYSIATPGALNVNGIALSMGGLNGSGVVTNSGAAATLTIGGASSTDATTNATGSFSGVITNSTNALNLFKVGIGTQTLTGANSFTGNVTIGQTSAAPGGILAITNSLALGVGTKTVSIISNAGSNQASLQLDGSGGAITLGSNISFTTSQGSTTQPAIVNVAGNNTINGGFTLTVGGGNTTIFSTTGILTMAGAVTTSTSGRALVLGGSSTGSGVYSGAIGQGSVPNQLALQKEGTNTWTLNNTANSFTGNVTINGGTLVATGASGGTNGVLGVVNAAGRSVTANSGSTLSFTTNNIFGNGVGNANLPAVILNGATLTSTRYNVLGDLTLNNGATLTQSSIDPIGSYEGFQFRGSVNVTGTSVSTIAATTGRGNHLGANTTFNVADVTSSTATDLNVGVPLLNQSADFSSAAGGLTKAGVGTLTLSAANTYTGATTVNAGTLAAGVASVANVSGAFGNNSAVTMANVAGATLDITGFNTQIGSLAGGGATGGNVVLGAATLTTGADNTSTSFGGVISGTGSVTKIGTGTQTITNAQTYSGTTNITGGTLALGTGGGLNDSGLVNVSTSSSIFDISAITGTEVIGSLSSVAGSSIKLGANILDVGGNNTSFSSAGDISGTGSITKSGTGTMTLNGNNTYTGSTNVSGGTLLLAASNVLPDTAALNLSSGAVLNTGGFSDTTGALSVNTTATIDLSSGSTSELTFASTASWSGILSVWNYTGGAIWTASTGDKLTFTTNSLTAGDLANIQFYSDNGLTPIGTGADFVGGGTELVPVPEPSAALASILLLGTLGYRERRRLLHFRK